MASTSAATLELCIAACDATTGCVDVAWVYGACYLKSSVGAAIANNNVLGAKLIASNGTSLTSLSTTSVATAATTALSTVSSPATGSSTTSSLTASSLATTSPATGSSTTNSATATASAISCPAANATTFVGSTGQTFLVECGVDHNAGDLGDSTQSSCVAVAYLPGICYMKSSIGYPNANANVWGAKVVSSSSSSSSSSATSVTGVSSATATSSITSVVTSSTTPSVATSAASTATDSSALVVSTSSAASSTSSLATTLITLTTSPSSTVTPTSSSPATTSSSSILTASSTSTSPTQTCGAGYRLSVTEDTTYTPRFFARQAYNGTSNSTWSLATCYLDNVGGARTLPTRLVIDSGSTANVTVAKCLDACAAGGYAWCGVEYYYECWGAGVKPASTLVAATSDGSADPLMAGCDYPCSGNSTEACGGANRLLVYVNNATLSS